MPDPPRQVLVDAPYVTTPPVVIEEMLRIADVSPADVLYDLGCGDGRIVIEAALKRGARGLGIDLNPDLVRTAETEAARLRLGRLARFELGDIYNADLRDATVVTLFLLPDVNLALCDVLKRDLRPGSRVVSHTWDMGDWRPDRKRRAGSTVVYCWTIR